MQASTTMSVRRPSTSTKHGAIWRATEARSIASPRMRALGKARQIRRPDQPDMNARAKERMSSRV